LLNKIFFVLPLVAILISCDTVPFKNSDVASVASKIAIKAAQPQFEKLYFDQAPILPPESSRFTTLDKLPGRQFNPDLIASQKLSYNAEGKILLTEGDFIIPVMTFCMNPYGASATAHNYILSELQGRKSKILRELNLKALTKFSPEDIQILSWSLQAGLTYAEFSKTSQQIIDNVLPQYKPELHDSFITEFEKKWDELSDKSQGQIPTFNATSNELLSALGVVGQKINQVRKFRTQLEENGNDFSVLSRSIEIIEKAQKDRQAVIPKWSKINDRVYAQFVTQDHYLKIGYLQIRILPEVRSTSSALFSTTPSLSSQSLSTVQKSKIALDILSWQADPQTPSIQPLSFSPIIGYGGVAALPTLIDAPPAALLAVAAVLASRAIDWTTFNDLYNLLKNTSESNIKKILENGLNTLRKEHDELEKPLRKNKIINRNTKETTTDSKGNVREYQKSGGDEALNKDFDSLPGEPSKAQDGTEMKTLPNGSKAIKRPSSIDKEKVATLEIQPPSHTLKPESRLRIKVRY
jgi:hypothetical protein